MSMSLFLTPVHAQVQIQTHLLEKPRELPAGAEDALWANVIPEPNTGCWLWLGGHNGRGLGRVMVQGRRFVAARLAYELHRGPIPEGMVVSQVSCATVSCCNPRHLGLLACPAEVAQRRGTIRRGEQVTRARLTEQMVRDIRSRAANGEAQAAIARALGFAQPTINQIVLRRSWAHVK